ncbi:nucleolar protein,Nop52-domain-containing protein [Chytridium lagenaria]|nr:nucleolar protein,Nop52-domain-containing protein [Chytridium lagenaria]
MNESFGKFLASVDKKVRDNAVNRLVEWIKGKKDLSDLDLVKLWKGLFYCFWLSDKGPVQQHLATKLSDIILNLEEDLAFRFLRAFWTIIGLEWHGIDRLRLDKYYMLLRKFTCNSFKLLASLDFAEEAVKNHSDILSSGPLSVGNPKFPDSLRYHITDSFVEELRNSAPAQEIPASVFDPFFDFLQSSSNKILLEKVETLFTGLLPKESEDDDEEDEENEAETELQVNQQEIGERLNAITESDELKALNRATSTRLRALFLGQPAPPVAKPSVASGKVRALQASELKRAKKLKAVKKEAQKKKKTVKFVRKRN